MRPHLLPTVLALALLLTSCDFGVPDADAPPRPLSPTERQTVRSGNAFGLKLFRSVHTANTGKPNVVVSPLSVSMALGMTLNGAEGETRTAMEKTLERSNLSAAEINDAYRSLIDLLLGLDPSVQMEIANSIWHRNTFPVEQAFKDTNRVHFDATVEGLDFGSPNAVNRINEWVRTSTQGTIDTIVQDIPPRVMMYIMNAIYFKGRWRQPFDPADTKQAPFHHPDGSTSQVDMMTLESPIFPHARMDEYQAVDLAYGDSLYTMTLVVPDEGVPLDSVVSTLDREQWKTTTAQLQPARLASLSMPKFKIDYKTSLNRALQSMGMDVAFDPNRANFDGINPNQEDLHISNVKHKTFIEVDEEGTEASAATSVAVRVTSAPPKIRVDRPFAFVLRERHSGTILFMGSVTDPAAGS